MTNKVHERVLLENGEFGHFPERYIEAAVKREEREPVHIPQDEPLIPHGEKGKAEIASKKAKKK